ncbi:MAG TPA: hypothetical protein VJX70_12455 [Candidatus Acidoferrum sp.]|nr:hypothetical protein [Candidatus Acidoferrum sp.]
MDQPRKGGISRRQFARRAALLSATASIAPAARVFSGSLPAPAQQPPDLHPHLSADSQMEAEARYQQILSQYGSRFSAEEKTIIQQTNLTIQTSLDKIRAYPLDNSDGPALYLKPLVEREKKKPATPASAPAKKS